MAQETRLQREEGAHFSSLCAGQALASFSRLCVRSTQPVDRTVIFKGINQNVSICLFRFVQIFQLYLYLYLFPKTEIPKTWKKIPKTWSGKMIVWRQI